jgi:pSer/pThr/pTyr-binding forkhead associated (FHA) protein
MDENYGQLVLVREGGAERAFDLNKTSITLGRDLANDIVLGDVRVSRSHARLACGPAGCEIIDLGSSNGTRLNGVPVQRSKLSPGDTIGLGSSQLVYHVEQPMEDLEATWLDTSADLALTLEREFLPMSINETGLPRLVVFTREETWEVPLQDVDAVTIGRADDNQVVVDLDNVSRCHAEVVRKGGAWLLHDLGSTNGTWLKGERVDVDQVLLQEGDVFRIGPAQVVFKGGANVEAMTMLDETFARMPARRPVVFVPGMMGSDLWLGNERVWPSVKALLAGPELFRYPSEVPLEPRGIVDEVVIVPNLIKQDQYNRLGDYLVEELGYARGKDFFEFAYDWRQDVRLSAHELAQTIDGLPTAQPVTLIAHSLGTLISRYYVERLGGNKRAERLMLMGGPHLGTVKAMTSLLIAPSLLPFGLMGERLRRVLVTFPSSYQIVPTYACARDQRFNKINFMDDESWLAEEQLPLLRAAREFRRELGSRSSIPTISIFGYGYKTASSITLTRTPTGEISDVAIHSTPNGDGGVLETSAVLPGSEIHPVQQYHGSLFVDNDVRMRLKLELARQFLPS